MSRTGIAVESGTGDETDGNSMSRVEKRLERALEETGGDGDGEEEEGADGWEEGCTGMAPLLAGPDSERRTSAKMRPFRRNGNMRGVDVNSCVVGQKGVKECTGRR